MADNYYIYADVVGADQIQEMFKKAGDYAKTQMSKAINNTGFQLEKLAVQKAPHRKGGLRSSIHFDQSPGHTAQITEDNVVGVVGTDLKYARAQEKGTKGLTIVVPNGRKIVRNGVVVGRTKPYTYQGNIKAKYYMRDASKEIMPFFIDQMKQAVSNIVDYLANT